MLPWSLAATTLAAGCTSLIGVDQLPAAEPFSYASTACELCIGQQCQLQEDACRTDRSCAGLYACLARCPADAVHCRATCEADHPDVLDQPAIVALESCRRNNCLDGCVGVSAADWVGAACDDCLQEKCTAAVRGCIELSGCERVAACNTSCDNPDCYFQCHRDLPEDAKERAGAVEQCINSCHDVCTGEGDWGCVEGYSWTLPSSIADPIAVSGKVHHFDFVGNPAVGGLEVRGCNWALADCSLVEAADVSASDGSWQLDLPSSLTGWSGYFDAKGTIAGSPVHPTHLYAGRPIGVAQSGLGLTVFNEVTYALFESVAEAQGITALADFGHVYVEVRDCITSYARGLEVDVLPPERKSGQWQVWYFESDEQQTSQAGLAILANLTPGAGELVMKRDSQIVGRTAVLISADTAIVTTIYPQPR